MVHKLKFSQADVLRLIITEMSVGDFAVVHPLVATAVEREHNYTCAGLRGRMVLSHVQ